MSFAPLKLLLIIFYKASRSQDPDVYLHLFLFLFLTRLQSTAKQITKLLGYPSPANYQDDKGNQIECRLLKVTSTGNGDKNRRYNTSQEN